VLPIWWRYLNSQGISFQDADWNQQGIVSGSEARVFALFGLKHNMTTMTHMTHMIIQKENMTPYMIENIMSSVGIYCHVAQ
jgi:hypothetical protein